MTIFKHTPVFLKESIDLLSAKEEGIYVDATIGGGGHSLEILKRTRGKIHLIGIDRDERALETSKKRIEEAGYNASFAKGNFADIKEILKGLNIDSVNGILFDLGVSSHQIDSPERGFSLRSDGPLDMRMDASLNISAEDLINDLGKEDLKRIIKEFGEDKFAGKIASAIVKAREEEHINTTFKLKDIIEKARGGSPKQKLDSVTRAFQALRIEVNQELLSLNKALNDSIEILKKHGRIVVISYHSLEDRIVKDKFNLEARDCTCPPKFPKCVCSHEKKLNILTKKPIVPSAEEVDQNPRSRSAKMRAAERI